MTGTVEPLRPRRDKEAEGGKVSAKIRFEVFKRDGFTCQYCGKRTPEAVLEADHVIPVSRGGTDDMQNLVTSCWECNRGKGASLLDERAPIPDIHDRTILMLERERQLKEYNYVRGIQREREDGEIDALLIYWDDLAGGRARQFPKNTTLRSYLRILSLEDIKDAMEIAMEKAGDYRGCKYLAGILRNWASAQGAPEE